MPRLIDKRDAIKHLKKLLKNNIMPTEWYEGAKSAITLLKKEPTVDAVEVVRCKDCKHASLTYDGECKYCQRWKEKYDGESVSLYLDGDFYCAFGERREDD